MDQEAELVKRLQEMGQGEKTEKVREDRRLDPARIKVVNWSRRRKRNKKLWRTTQGRGGGNTVSVDQIKQMLGGS